MQKKFLMLQQRSVCAFRSNFGVNMNFFPQSWCLWQAYRVHRVPTLGSNISIRLWYVDFEYNAGSVTLKKMLNASANASVCFMFQFLSLYTNFHNLDACGKSTVCPPLTLQWRLLYAFCFIWAYMSNKIITVFILVASLPCAPCAHFRELYINFSQCWRSRRALRVRRVPHLGTQDLYV